MPPAFTLGLPLNRRDVLISASALTTLDPSEVSDAVIALAATKFGTRASRLTVGPYKDGIDTVNSAHEQLQNDMISHNRIADLLTLKS